MPTRINVTYNVEEFFEAKNLLDLKKEAKDKGIPFEVYAYIKLDMYMTKHREHKAKKAKDAVINGEDPDLTDLNHAQKLEVIKMRKEKREGEHFTKGSGLSTRAENLLRENFSSLDDLTTYVLDNGPSGLKKIEGMGKKTAQEIVDYLKVETDIGI